MGVAPEHPLFGQSLKVWSDVRSPHRLNESPGVVRVDVENVGSDQFLIPESRVRSASSDESVSGRSVATIELRVQAGGRVIYVTAVALYDQRQTFFSFVIRPPMIHSTT